MCSGWWLCALHVEYVERRTEYGILFIFSLFCEYINLEYICIHVICRVNLAAYAIRIPIAAPQEYVNTYSTSRLCARGECGAAQSVCYARRMGQPTQRATNYTATSNIDPAQIFLHANGQSAPRSGGARDVGRGAGSHTPNTASESLSQKRPTEKFDVCVRFVGGGWRLACFTRKKSAQ